MHIRRSFLEALKAQLIATGSFGGVWIQRTGPARPIYPSITLFADQEQTETLGIHVHPRPQDRVLNISVMVWIRGTANDERPDEEMDKAALLVESTLRQPAGSDDMDLIATDFQVHEDEPEINAVTLTYRLTYHTTEFNPV